MQHNERIILVIDLFDLVGNLDLVLYGQITRIKKFLKLDNFVENPFFKCSDGSDTLIRLTPHFLRILFVIEVRIYFQSIHEPLLRLVAIWGVDHGEGSSRTDYEHSGKRLVY